jgi:ABC-type lipoprotein release transport system permease subunit
MLIIKLILRNIFAHKIRSIITFTVVSIVSAVLFLFLSFSDGQLENLDKGVLPLRNPVADIAAHRKGYTEAFARDEEWENIREITITDYFRLKEGLKQFEFIESVYNKTVPVLPQVYFNGSRYKPFIFNGIDLEDPEYILSRIDIIEGGFLSPEENHTILFNINSKDTLKAEPGDTVTILGTDLFGQAVVQDVSVRGYFRGKTDSVLLNSLAFIDMDTYSIISGYFTGETLQVNIDLNEGFSVSSQLEILNEWAAGNYSEVEFVDYKKTHEDEEGAEYRAFRLIIIFMCLLAIFIVTFGIMNIIAVNLLDRKKEIGTYYCLGAEKSFLIWLYSLEILFLNISAGVCGIIAGILIRLFINSLNITTADQGVQLVFAGNVFRLGMSLSTVTWILAGIAAITFIISQILLKSGLKVSPQAAMRET